MVSARTEQALVDYFNTWDRANPGVARPVIRVHFSGHVYFGNNVSQQLTHKHIEGRTKRLRNRIAQAAIAQ